MRTSVLMDRNAPVQSKTAVSYIALKLIVSGAMKPTENKEPKIHRINPFTNTGPNGIHDLSVTEVLGPAPDAVRDMGDQWEKLVWLMQEHFRGTLGWHIYMKRM